MGEYQLDSTKLKPLPQQISQSVRQCSNIPQNNIERKWERVNIFAEDRLAVGKIDCLHVQQRAGWVVQDDESIQHALLG